MLTHELGGKPQEVYTGIVDKVSEIFGDEGIILTGSAIGLIDGTSEDLTTNRIAYFRTPETEGYIKLVSPKDVDLLVVSPTELKNATDYFPEKAKALEEIPKEYRDLLDIGIVDLKLLTILRELSETAEQYENAHSTEDLDALVQLRNHRAILINGNLKQSGFLYSSLNDVPFLNFSQIPSGNHLHSYTASIACGMDYDVLANPELSERVVEASKSAYTPEELGEKGAESEAVKRLKDSDIQGLSEQSMQLFLMLARHEGFQKTETEQGRNIKGMWDPNMPQNYVDMLKSELEKENPKLFELL